MKTMKVRMTDTEGKIYIWTVCAQKAVNLTLGQKPRKVQGWQYTDHEGYSRFVEGNWNDLVPAFHLTANNYGFTSTLS